MGTFPDPRTASRPLGPGYDIIVYPGQSNSVGNGIGPFEPGDDSRDGRCFQIGRSRGVDKKIIPMTPKLHFCQLGSRRHGHGIAFARLYAASMLEPERCVLIVPAAMGNTSILHWLGRGRTPRLRGLYDDMAARIDLVLSRPRGTNRIVAWVEHQGELDIGAAALKDHPLHRYMPNAATYAEHKRQLIDRVRGHFGVFPMLFGLYSERWRSASDTKMEFEAILKETASSYAGCRTVSMAGLADNSTIDPKESPVHFSAQAQEEIARRHIAALSSLLAVTSKRQPDQALSRRTMGALE